MMWVYFAVDENGIFEGEEECENLAGYRVGFYKPSGDFYSPDEDFALHEEHEAQRFTNFLNGGSGMSFPGEEECEIQSEARRRD